MDVLTAMTHQFRQLYSKLFPIPCFLCGTACHNSPLCHDCSGDLPRLGTACLRCASPVTTGSVCGRCLQKPPAQDLSFSLLRYEGAARQCITAFKFNRQLQLSKVFADLMTTVLQPRQDLPQCLIPIPLHPRRLRSRGYNQAAVLADLLSQHLGIEHQPHNLIRTRNTAPQSSLPYKQRRKNLKQAFAWHGGPPPSRVVLIDDVMTSGHTCSEAAKVLRAQGAEFVEVWTIARAISHY